MADTGYENLTQAHSEMPYLHRVAPIIIPRSGVNKTN